MRCCNWLWSSSCGCWIFHLTVSSKKKNIFPWKPLGYSSVLFGLALGVLYLMIFEKKNISSWKPLGSSLVLFRFGSKCSPICVETCSTVFQFCTDVLGMVSNWSFYLCIWASLTTRLVKNPPAMQETWFDSWVRKIPWRRDRLPTPVFLGFPCGSAGKESTCNVGDPGSM